MTWQRVALHEQEQGVEQELEQEQAAVRRRRSAFSAQCSSAVATPDAARLPSAVRHAFGDADVCAAMLCLLYRLLPTLLCSAPAQKAAQEQGISRRPR